MRTRLAVLSLLAAGTLLLSACGSSGGDDAADTGAGKPDTTAPTDGGSDDGSNGGGSDSGGADGKVDCAALQTAQQDLLSVQLLAQIRDPSSIAAMKAGTIGNLDLDRFIASMGTLHALDGHKSALGDPKEALDIYEQAGKDAKALFENPDTTQADIDAYNASIGSATEFLGHQTAIAGALDEVDC